ncbi:DUF4347 domain-containing protein [Thalassobaculum sp.]|uniref:DUF4347 domain-containing protein n=1 Tax=Thalassobaculum sp. TaxID=2022740 RepID=UPI003B5C6D47
MKFDVNTVLDKVPVAPSPASSGIALVVIDDDLPARAALAETFVGPFRIARFAASDTPLQTLSTLIEQAGNSVSAVHLFSHGEPGVLHLGGSRVTLMSLLHDVAGVAALRRALDGRPLVLYGCSLGRDEIGRRFVQVLSRSLAAPVTASSTPTGGRAYGGDWRLDVSAGASTPVVRSLVDPALGAHWPGLLAGSTNVTSTAGDTSAGTIRAAAADASDFQTFVFQNIAAPNPTTITLTGPLTFTHGAAVSWQFGGTTTDLTFSGNTISAASHIYAQLNNASHTLTINSTIDLGGSGANRIFLLQGGNGVFNSSIADVGILQIVSNGTATLGTTTSPGTIDINTGGTLTFTTGATYTSTLEIENTATIDTNGQNVTFNGAVRDDGTNVLVKTGTGTLTLSGTNIASGTMTVNQGTLSVASDANLSAGTVTINGGTLAVTGVTTINNAIALGASNGTIDASAAASISGNISGTGSLTKTGNSTLTLAGTNTYSGGTTISAGTVRLSGGNALSDTGTVTINAGATLDLNNTSETIGTLAGSGTLAVGTGSITLTSSTASTFTGSLTGSGTYSVASGVTLKGTGTYSTAVTIQSGATIAPGNSPGIINTGNLTLASGSTATMEIDGTAAGTGYDQINVSGTVTISSAALNVVLGYTPAIGDSYTLINNDGTDDVTGTFSGLAEGATTTINGQLFRISYAGGTGNDVTLQAVEASSGDSGGQPSPAQALSGTTADDLLRGADGNDTLYGLGGNDTLSGGTDIDVLYGNLGDDLLYGNQAADSLYGGQGTDTAYGGAGDDRLWGNHGNDVLHGNQGADLIYGNAGDDRIWGDDGADTLYGGQGADTLSGGAGNDQIFGNSGADIFRVDDADGADAIHDFALGVDRLMVAVNVNGTAVASADHLLARLFDDGAGNAVLDLGSGNSVTLVGLAASQLGTDSFLIG